MLNSSLRYLKDICSRLKFTHSTRYSTPLLSVPQHDAREAGTSRGVESELRDIYSERLLLSKLDMDHPVGAMRRQNNFLILEGRCNDAETVQDGNDQARARTEGRAFPKLQ